MSRKHKICITFLLLIFIPFSLFSQTGSAAGFAEEEFRRGVQAFYRGSFNDAILQFEKALAYLPEEGLILEWLGKSYYKAGLEGAAIQQWQYAIDLGYGGQLLENSIEITKERRALQSEFTLEERYVEASDFYGLENSNIYFGNPVGVLPCSNGCFWTVAYSTNEILLFDVNGTIIDRKRGPVNGFDGPMDIIRSKNGNIYVSEFNGDRISILDENCNYISSFGEKGRGLGQLLGPQYLAIDSNENIFVTDYGNNRIAVYNSEGIPLFDFGDFISPTGIAILNDTIYVTDSIKGNIACYDNAGNYLYDLVLENTFEKPENISAINDILILVDLNKIYGINSDSGKVTEIASIGNSPTRLSSANIDKNSNLVVSDFVGNQIYVLSRMSELIGGLFVEIVRVNADNFPNVAVEVKVENRRREPVVGLKDLNFLITEDKYNVSNQKLTGTAYENEICDLTIILDRSLSMKKYEEEVTQAVKEIASAMKGNGTLRIICDGAIPTTEIVSNPESLTNFQISKLKTGYASKISTDLAIRLATNDLINGELKRGIVYITNDTFDNSTFNNYSLNDLSNFMNNNEVSFSVISVSSGMVSPEIDFLAENTKGQIYNLYRPEGVSQIVDDILSLSSGVYTFTYTSSLSTNFGRDYLPIEIEAYLLNKSGRAESGYYAPLQ